VSTYPGAVVGPTTRTWETSSGGCATSSRAALRSPPRAAIRSRTCAMGPTGPARHARPHPGRVRGHLLHPVRGPLRRHSHTNRAGHRSGDIQVTLADSVRWLFEQGHISPRQAGRLATELDNELLPVGTGELPADRQRWTIRGCQHQSRTLTTSRPGPGVLGGESHPLASAVVLTRTTAGRPGRPDGRLGCEPGVGDRVAVRIQPKVDGPKLRDTSHGRLLYVGSARSVWVTPKRRTGAGRSMPTSEPQASRRWALVNGHRNLLTRLS